MHTVHFPFCKKAFSFPPLVMTKRLNFLFFFLSQYKGKREEGGRVIKTQFSQLRPVICHLYCFSIVFIAPLMAGLVREGELECESSWFCCCCQCLRAPIPVPADFNVPADCWQPASSCGRHDAVNCFSMFFTQIGSNYKLKEV